MEHSIRKAGIEDLGALVALCLAEARETENLELKTEVVQAGVSKVLQEGGKYGFFLVASVGPILVGCVRFTPDWAVWRNGFFWWIRSVYVSAEYRRKGVFTSMYREARRRLEAERDSLGMRLYVRMENSAAIGTYVKLGLSDSGYAVYQEFFRKWNE